MDHATRWTRRIAATWLLATVATLVATVGTAHACSCADVDPVGAVSSSDIVFTGTAIESETGEWETRWVFDVVGVIKGAPPAQLDVIGEDWGAGCGTDFGRFDEPVVVYVTRQEDGALWARGCMPSPTADAFMDLVEAGSAETVGSGPVEAIAVGTMGANDIALLDANGDAITMTALGIPHGIVDHCDGTTLAAITSSEDAVVHLVDLETLTIVRTEALPSDLWFSPFGDRILCRDGGDEFVMAGGYGPNVGGVDVVSVRAEDRTAERFSSVSRAVPHASGSVLLLPSNAGGSILAVDSTDLSTERGRLAMPEEVAVLDGAVSTADDRLALLATVDGTNLEWDTGATHLILVSLDDGVPVALLGEPVPLKSPGARIESPEGAAKDVRWVDDHSLAVVIETMSEIRVTIIDEDGAVALPPTSTGWGSTPTSTSQGVLLARNGGVRLLNLDGTLVDGTPPPADERFGGELAIESIDDAPPFDPSAAPTEPLIIIPIDQVITDPEFTAVSGPESGGPATAILWVVAPLLLLGLALAGSVIVIRRSESLKKS